MATTTTKILLRKPAGADNVNVALDISGNMDLLDARLGAKVQYRRTTGNMPISVLNPITGAGTTTGDLILKAVVGDWIEVSANGLWDNQAFTGYLDVWSRLAGTPVNSWGGNNWTVPISGHQGIPGWRGEISSYSQISGSIIRQIVAGDLDGSSNVTLTPYATTGSASVKNIFSSVAVLFEWHAINHGNP